MAGRDGSDEPGFVPSPMEGDEMRKLWLPIVMCAGLMASSVAGGETTDVFLMSLEELLDLRISVASVQANPIRKQPGIVTVITSADIRESGARDLEDILHRVPGFATGLDVTGVTGMGFRGFWAYVGQILFIVDGLEITDGLFGVFPTGGHIPAAQIERIEIIRGPGSARYGGNAELAVIKISTKAAKQDGVSVHTSFGTSGDSFSQRYGYTFGQNFEDGHAYLGASLGRDYRSDRDYRGSDGTVFDMAGDSDIDTLLLTFGLDYKGLTVKGLLDSYHLDERTHYGEPQADTYDMDFENETREDDSVNEQHGWTVYVDVMRSCYLEDVTVNYVEGLSYSGFQFDNPDAKRTCGCGSSFG